jgi:hypothetical protein
VSWRVPAVEADDPEDPEQAAAAQELAELLLVDVEAAAAYGFPIEGGRDVLGAMIGAIACGGAVRILDGQRPPDHPTSQRRQLEVSMWRRSWIKPRRRGAYRRHDKLPLEGLEHTPVAGNPSFQIRFRK